MNCVNGRISGISETHYRIALASEQSCKSCGMNEMCGQKVIELEKEKQPEHFKIGQSVQLEYKKVVQTSLIIYFLPLVFFFLGLGLSKALLGIQNEALQFVNALLALGFSLYIVNRISRRFGHKKFKVTIKPIN